MTRHHGINYLQLFTTTAC
ncbi:MAG: hypothetical protein COC14_00115 [Burkholderiaceae bacterium]|nr:MAG: hypothetical protein COC14_00115 [Burkholderiaceae bacterium]